VNRPVYQLASALGSATYIRKRFTRRIDKRCALIAGVEETGLKQVCHYIDDHSEHKLKVNRFNQEVLIFPDIRA